MKSVITELAPCKKQLQVEVPYEDVKPFFEKAYQSYQKKVKIDGFRKGKVPKSIVERRFGDAIRAEVTEDLIQHYFKKAVHENQLLIVAPGQIRNVSFEVNRPFTFTAEVEVQPDIEVKDYKGFKVEKEIYKVTVEDVERSLDMLRERKAELKDIDACAEKGHLVIGDLQGLDSSGVPIIGEKWENNTFEAGYPPFGDQLFGIKAGEEKRLNVPPNPEMPAGPQNQERRFIIHARSVKEKILPELDDRFAKDMGDFEDLKALKENIKNRLEAQYEQDAKRLLHNRIADEIIKRNDFEIPEPMVESGLRSLREEHEKKYGDNKLPEEKFREENRPSIIWNIKWNLIWNEIAKKENLVVADKEVESEIEKIVDSSQKEGPRMRAWFKSEERRERLKDSLLEEKVMDFLITSNRIKEVTIKKKTSGIVR